MTIYIGKLEITFKSNLEEQAVYNALRRIGKAVKADPDAEKVLLFLKPKDWIDVNL